jgi:hypothetical protein
MDKYGAFECSDASWDYANYEAMVDNISAVDLPNVSKSSIEKVCAQVYNEYHGKNALAKLRKPYTLKV